MPSPPPTTRDPGPPTCASFRRCCSAVIAGSAAASIEEKERGLADLERLRNGLVATHAAKAFREQHHGHPRHPELRDVAKRVTVATSEPRCLALSSSPSTGTRRTEEGVVDWLPQSGLCG
eukprot:TRINITY_DN36427_c0_g1_i1.p3 TRINITY_DN36427_c0_g1~~TRINITY_DN36427_c0_g1_i1.p3  ORF type:complete len:120 (+),score=18.21 TRINITY_DN36427_c0_g1_i1:193-552(+)